MSALSPREYEVLRLVASGLDAQQAADEMGIRPQTAKNLLRQAYHKLGAASRTQAFLRLGWLRVPTS